jgi:hypothetical protein
MQRLRILEIGPLGLFIHAVPDQTQFFWTGIKPRRFARSALGPVKLIKNVMRLRRREFDLLVVHVSQYPPWHPRSILTALRDWRLLSPLGLFSMFAWRFVHHFHNVPIAVVDMLDSCHIGSHNFFLLDACKAYFKRELPNDHWLAFCKSGYPNFPGRRWRSNGKNRLRVAKLRPISLGPRSRPDFIASSKKTTDIFFAGDIDCNSTTRKTGIVELRELEKEGYIVDIPEGRLTQPEYLRRMAAAWLAWSPGGLGWDCYRHYEAPLAGSVPLMNYPSILRHRPLRDGEHCLLYRAEPGGLVEAVRSALADRPRLCQMARAGAAHVFKHHTGYARAEYITLVAIGRRLDGTHAHRNDAVLASDGADRSNSELSG